jgi:hypothetical protein
MAVMLQRILLGRDTSQEMIADCSALIELTVPDKSGSSGPRSSSLQECEHLHARPHSPDYQSLIQRPDPIRPSDR